MDIATEAAKYVAYGAGMFGAGMLLIQGAVGAAIPTIMSYTATPTALGAVHGGLTVAATSFAAAPFFIPAAAAGALTGATYCVYRHI